VWRRDLWTAVAFPIEKANRAASRESSDRQMQCRHCRAWNDGEESRCTRCGHRLHLTGPRQDPDSYPIAAAATAPALESFPGGHPAAPETAAGGPPEEHAAFQPSLFRDSFGPKVIPIPTLTPARDRRGEAGPRRPPRSATPRNNPRRVSDSQKSLDFEAGRPDELDLQVEAVIVCDAPVALPTHRLIAATVDASMVVIALGVFFGIFYLSGGELALARENVVFFAGVAATLSLFYRTLWVLASGDSPGMAFAGLKVVDLDGRRPNRKKRAVRQVASLLSFMSVVGLVWALVDEENLAWHDHISKTFPTPR
jgi:uncharacterized RDD family membrane protein YckC